MKFQMLHRPITNSVATSRSVGVFQKIMNLYAIINPESRVGRTSSRVSDVVSAFQDSGIDAEVVLTEHGGHACDLAKKAAEEYSIILAIGGDGTVNEVVRGILESGSKTAMGVIPLGTGNDFARMVGVKDDLTFSMNQLRTSSPVPVDVGRVEWTEGGVRKKSAFINALGIGFDGHAAHIAPRYKRYPFQLGYLSAILVALTTWKCPRILLTDLELGSEYCYEGGLFFVTVGNARDSGGGYTINPKASITDGVLDVCLVKEIGRLRALKMLPSARTGKHLEQDEVAYWHSAGIHIQSEEGLPIHTDGEVQSISANDIHVKIDKKALNVMVPNGMESSI